MHKVKDTCADRIEAIDCIVLIEIIEKYPLLFYIVSSKKQEDLCIRYPYAMVRSAEWYVSKFSRHFKQANNFSP